MLEALLQCKLPFGIADVRFILEVHQAAEHGRAIMNAARQAYLWRIAVRFRDQLSPEIWTLADGWNPARSTTGVEPRKSRH